MNLDRELHAALREYRLFGTLVGLAAVLEDRVNFKRVKGPRAEQEKLVAERLRALVAELRNHRLPSRCHTLGKGSRVRGLNSNPRPLEPFFLATWR